MKMLTMAAMMLATVQSVYAQDKDTTVVVPETGVLPIKPSRNVTGPSDVIISSCFGSNTSGLVFTKFRMDTVVVGSSTNSSSALFLVAKPGTYTLKLTDELVTGKVNTTSVNWQEEPGKAYKKNRILYKYTVKDGKVGFVRDENYAADKYQYCDLAEGEHLYLPLAEKNVAAIATALNTTAAELSFIPFDGPWKNLPTQDEIVPTAVKSVRAAVVAPQYFNLLGRSVVKPSKGFYVKDNKIVIQK